MAIYTLHCIWKQKKVLKKKILILLVTQADKGNKTVIVFKVDYKNKMLNFLNSDKIYSILDKNPENVECR